MEFSDFLLVNCVWGENSLIDSIVLSKKEIRKGLRWKLYISKISPL